MKESYLHSPRKDQTGSNTPSSASRLWFIFTIILSIYIGFYFSGDDVVVWFMCSLTSSTVLLNLGWLVFSRMSETYDPVELFTYAEE